jgi:NAD(P)-dependent dehydrogenase (short-subunit alcohol dehydrogenase family)
MTLSVVTGANRGIGLALVAELKKRPHGGQVEPGDAARDLLPPVDDLTLATSGGFGHGKGQRLPW